PPAGGAARVASLAPLISWTGADGAGAEYEIEAAPAGPRPGSPLRALTTASRGHPVGLEAGRSYNVRVRALDRPAGEAGPWSESARLDVATEAPEDPPARALEAARALEPAAGID